MGTTGNRSAMSVKLSSSVQMGRICRGFSLLRVGLESNPRSIHLRNERRMYHNTLIKSCANAGNLQRAEHWLHQMEELGIQQNVKGFGKLMEADESKFKAPFSIGQ